MKCKYKLCRNGGNVDKSIAIKVGSSYYCPECYEEKELKSKAEQYYIEKFPQVSIALLRKAFSQIYNTYEVKYLLFVMEYIVKNNKPLNMPFGLVNYCNDCKIQNEFKMVKINKEYKQVKESIKENIDNTEVKFECKTNKTSWLNII